MCQRSASWWQECEAEAGNRELGVGLRDMHTKGCSQFPLSSLTPHFPKTLPPSKQSPELETGPLEPEPVDYVSDLNLNICHS